MEKGTNQDFKDKTVSWLVDKLMTSVKGDVKVDKNSSEATKRTIDEPPTLHEIKLDEFNGAVIYINDSLEYRFGVEEIAFISKYGPIVKGCMKVDQIGCSIVSKGLDLIKMGRALDIMVRIIGDDSEGRKVVKGWHAIYKCQIDMIEITRDFTLIYFSSEVYQWTLLRNHSKFK